MDNSPPLKASAIKRIKIHYFCFLVFKQYLPNLIDENDD